VPTTARTTATRGTAGMRKIVLSAGSMK